MVSNFSKKQDQAENLTPDKTTETTPPTVTGPSFTTPLDVYQAAVEDFRQAIRAFLDAAYMSDASDPFFYTKKLAPLHKRAEAREKSLKDAQSQLTAEINARFAVPSQEIDHDLPSYQEVMGDLEHQNQGYFRHINLANKEEQKCSSLWCLASKSWSLGVRPSFVVVMSQGTFMKGSFEESTPKDSNISKTFLKLPLRILSDQRQLLQDFRAMECICDHYRRVRELEKESKLRLEVVPSKPASKFFPSVVPPKPAHKSIPQVVPCKPAPNCIPQIHQKKRRETTAELHKRLLPWCSCPYCEGDRVDSDDEITEPESQKTGAAGDQRLLFKCACPHCKGHQNKPTGAESSVLKAVRPSIASLNVTQSRELLFSKNKEPQETVAESHRRLLPWCSCRDCEAEK